MRERTKDRIKNGLEFIVGMGILAYIKNAEISNQFVKGNVPDAIFSITNYTILRFINLKKPSLIAALGIAAIGTIGEFAQKFGLYHGTYDVKDIPMYFIGAGIAYGIDKLTYKNEQKKIKVVEEAGSKD